MVHSISTYKEIEAWAFYTYGIMSAYLTLSVLLVLTLKPVNKLYFVLIFIIQTSASIL